MKRISLPVILLFLWAVCPGRIMAQKPDSISGKLEIYQDMNINILMNKHIEVNQAAQTMDGFRIQVFFDSGNNSKTKAQSVLDEFILKFPKTRAYLTFKSPNYKVRVGDFRSRLDAQRFLNEIIADYPNAFIVTEQINLQNVE
jgi:hypothetical protein